MEPGALQQAQASGADDQSLWNKAPAWRNLTIAASLLTCTALALHLMPQPVEKSATLAPMPKPHPVQVATVAPAKPAIAPAAPAPAPAKPVATAATPAPVTHAKVITPVEAPHPVAAQPEPQPAPRLASIDEQPAAAPQPANAPQPAAQAADPDSVCTLTIRRLAPTPAYVGRVTDIDDAAMGNARIQLAQASRKGLMDPTYTDNVRVHIDMGGGKHNIVVVPKGMTVKIGDIVMADTSYRNPALPCNYVPNMITRNLGPQGNLPAPATAGVHE